MTNNSTNKFLIIIVFLLGFNFLLYAFFSYGILKNIVRLLIVLIILFTICFSNYTYKFREIMSLFIALYLIIIGGNIALNVSFAILIAISMKKNQNIEMICYYISLILTVIVLLSLALNIVQTETFINNNRVRNTLGFYHVNAGSMFFFSTLILFLYSRIELKVIHIIITSMISYMIFWFTDSRTSFIGLIFFALIYFLLPKARLLTNIVEIFDIVCLLSPFIFITLKIDNIVFDKLLSGRLHIIYDFLYQTSMTNLIIGGNTSVEIDNFYLMLLYNVGIFLYLLFVLITIKSLFFYKRNKDYKAISYISSILFIGLAESGPVRCEIVCMILFWLLIFKPTVIKEDFDCKNNE